MLRNNENIIPDNSKEIRQLYTIFLTSKENTMAMEMKHYYFFKSFIYLFILRVGEQREREEEKIPSRLHTVSPEPDTGLGLMNREIMT